MWHTPRDKADRVREKLDELNEKFEIEIAELETAFNAQDEELE